MSPIVSMPYSASREAIPAPTRQKSVSGRCGHRLPTCSAVGLFVELGYPDAVAVRCHLFRHNVHGHLGQIEVGADAGGGGDACFGQYGAYHSEGELVGRHAVSGEIWSEVNEYLVDGVDVDILRSHIAQIYAVDAGAEGR